MGKPLLPMQKPHTQHTLSGINHQLLTVDTSMHPCQQNPSCAENTRTSLGTQVTMYHSIYTKDKRDMIIKLIGGPNHGEYLDLPRSVNKIYRKDCEYWMVPYKGGLPNRNGLYTEFYHCPDAV